MEFLLFIGTILLIGAISAFFEWINSIMQSAALDQFKKKHSAQLFEIENEITNLSLNISSLKSEKFERKTFGTCYCCKGGNLVLRQNKKSKSLFIGCTNYHPEFKSCNFSFPLI